MPQLFLESNIKVRLKSEDVSSSQVLEICGELSFPAYRCRACDGYYTLVTNTVFEGTRQKPATVVLILRGVAKGESTARLSRELGLDRKRLGEIRQQLQQNVYESLPTERMEGTEFEADELYQNAGEKKHTPSRSQ